MPQSKGILRRGMDPLTSAEKALVAEHLGLVGAVLRKVFARRRHLNRFYDDLFQAGCLGLMRAAKTNNPALGKFTTHGWYWIEAYVTCEARNLTRPLSGTRHPRAAGVEVSFVSTDEEPILDLTVSETTPEAIITSARVAEKLAQQINLTNRRYRNAPEGKKDATPGQRDAAIFLQVEFGEDTLENIGGQHGVTKERVRQIHLQAAPHFDRLAGEYTREVEAA